jgi:hypothetical protein
MDKTDQRRDHETGDWVSDLKPGATTESKVDKGVEDTFPASDPTMTMGATGFISPDGEDTAQSANSVLESSGSTYADHALQRADKVRKAASAAVSQQPLTALLIPGAVGWLLGLLATSRR